MLLLRVQLKTTSLLNGCFNQLTIRVTYKQKVAIVKLANKQDNQGCEFLPIRTMNKALIIEY